MSESAPRVQLRHATPADVEPMHAIEAVSFSDPWSRYALAGAIGSPGIIVTVAELGVPGADRPELGGYSVVARAADEAELLNLAVAEGARGQGIGAALVERAIADATQWGARAMFLEVRASNAVALGLYQRAGFREAGRRRGYYRHPSEDALILRRELVPGRNDDTRTPSLARI
ncbi:MAG TPA: ribosomal protein S18-alanine N-acetyltransferase [Gemmatimonadaceae bacterium]|nr:ribosomal protein S18-alanine N-acetyltransferase [Gemmatimonadaceae bacterium]